MQTVPIKPLLVVNFFGGPGAAKSTMATHVFAELKWIKMNVEYVSEYAKDLTWDGHFTVLNNQYRVFGEQLHRIERLRDKVDVAVTDSPFLLSAVYNNRNNGLTQSVLTEFNAEHYIMLNFLITRVKDYVKIGRSQTEAEAREIDKKVKSFLDDNGVSYQEVRGERDSVSKVIDKIIEVNFFR